MTTAAANTAKMAMTIKSSTRVNPVTNFRLHNLTQRKISEKCSPTVCNGVNPRDKNPFLFSDEEGFIIPSLRPMTI
jgi:hypothetical protein